MKKFGFYLAITAVVFTSMSMGLAFMQGNIYKGLFFMLLMLGNVGCIWVNRDF